MPDLTGVGTPMQGVPACPKALHEIRQKSPQRVCLIGQVSPRASPVREALRAFPLVSDIVTHSNEEEPVRPEDLVEPTRISERYAETMDRDVILSGRAWELARQVAVLDCARAIPARVPDRDKRSADRKAINIARYGLRDRLTAWCATYAAAPLTEADNLVASVAQEEGTHVRTDGAVLVLDDWLRFQAEDWQGFARNICTAYAHYGRTDLKDVAWRCIADIQAYGRLIERIAT